MVLRNLSQAFALVVIGGLVACAANANASGDDDGSQSGASSASSNKCEQTLNMHSLDTCVDCCVSANPQAKAFADQLGKCNTGCGTMPDEASAAACSAKCEATYNTACDGANGACNSYNTCANGCFGFNSDQVSSSQGSDASELSIKLGIGVQTKGAEDPSAANEANDKDSAHTAPPDFKSDTDRRDYNKRTNKGKALADQRYYNKDGSYYKPDPKNAGVWNQYDKDGNHMGDVTSANLPDKQGPLGISSTLSDGYNNVWGKWCTQEQAGGFRALCSGTASSPGGVKGAK
jgi:hypothetical protein